MFSNTSLRLVILSASLLGGLAFAQGQAKEAASIEEPKYFHLDFVLKELENAKVINSRSYATTVATNDPSKSIIRAGNKVPVQTGGASGNLTYIDVGVNIDCWSARASQDRLALYVSAESSSAPTNQPSTAPMIRQNKWDSVVVVPFRKPTVVFTSDDPGSKHQIQLELTAVPIN
jgi:hypothetical protein